MRVLDKIVPALTHVTSIIDFNPHMLQSRLLYTGCTKKNVRVAHLHCCCGRSRATLAGRRVTKLPGTYKQSETLRQTKSNNKVHMFWHEGLRLRDEEQAKTKLLRPNK